MTAANRLHKSLRRRTALVATVAAIGLAWAATAVADGGGPADLTVVNRETGQPLRVWRWHGRRFVVGEPGARYSLRVTNHSSGRVMLVMSVDGLNILTGETAGYGQNGYVLRPYETYDATGWRKSDTEVAAFSFASLPQSYAARTGRPADVGVIGMAVFTERPPVEVQAAPPAVLPESDEDSAAPSKTMPDRAYSLMRPSAPAPAPPPPPSLARAPSADTAPRTEKLGTAHGAREWSTISHTEFERTTPYPQSVVRIEYDTWDNLVARGVIPRVTAPPHRPRPFPAGPDGAGYVPDPPPEP